MNSLLLLIILAGARPAASSASPFDGLPEGKLPLQLKHDESGSTGPAALAKIPEVELMKRVVKPLAALAKKEGAVGAGLAAFALQHATSTRITEAGTQFGLVQRLKVNGATVVLAKLHTESGEEMAHQSSDGLYALVLDASGAIVAAPLASLWSSSMAGSDAIDGALAADGTLTTTELFSGGDGDREGETRTVKIAAGEVRTQPSRFGPDGMFRDEKSRELLAITSLKGSFASEVVYRARAGKPPQTLEIASRAEAKGVVTVRFPKSPKDYVVTYSADRGSVSCRNPDATVQVFVRTGLSFTEPPP